MRALRSRRKALILIAAGGAAALLAVDLLYLGHTRDAVVQVYWITHLLPSITWWWLAPNAAVFLLAFLLRAFQMRLVLQPLKRTSLRTLFTARVHSDLTGRFVTHYVGYLAFVEAVARKERLARSAILGAFLAFTPIDSLSVMLLTLFAGFAMPTQRLGEGPIWGSLLGLAALAVAGLLSHGRGRLRIHIRLPDGVARIPVVGGRLRPVGVFLRSTLHGMSVFAQQLIRRPRLVAILLLMSLSATLLNVVSLYVMAQAVGLRQPFLVILIMALAGTISGSAVSVPGPFGLKEVVRASVLFSFGVAYWRAVSYIVLAELVWTAMLALASLISLARTAGLGSRLLARLMRYRSVPSKAWRESNESIRAKRFDDRRHS